MDNYRLREIEFISGGLMSEGHKNEKEVIFFKTSFSFNIIFINNKISAPLLENDWSKKNGQN